MLTIKPTKPTESIDDPYRVRYYDNVMPIELWRKLSETFPPDELMLPLQAVGNKYNLCDRDIEPFRAALATRPEWADLFKYIRKNFAQLSRDVVGLNMHAKQVRIEWSSMPGNGGSILPHPDTAKKLATAVMYFCGEDWQDEWGGGFEALRHKTEPNANWTDKRCGFDDCDTALCVKVRPNRMLWMHRTNNSLHAVRPCKAPRSRKTVTINLIGRPA